ncbi:MAG: ATP-grasp domain-containing protein [Chitinophagaceae bacterium]
MFFLSTLSGPSGRPGVLPSVLDVYFFSFIYPVFFCSGWKYSAQHFLLSSTPAKRRQAFQVGQATDSLPSQYSNVSYYLQIIIMDRPTILLIPEKSDTEFEQVFATWIKNGGQIKRLGKYWIKDEELTKQKIAIYGNQTFAFVLAQIYNVELLSPDDTLIARLGNEWTKRNVELKQINQISEEDFPVFIKPVIPKIFIADIFQTIADFKEATNGLQDTEEILVASIVDNIQAEARIFVKDGIVKDIALYEGAADLASGKEFVSKFISDNKSKLPNVVVVDIAFSEQTGWFILEFNACWGAGLNGCNAEKVIDCIIDATINS